MRSDQLQTPRESTLLVGLGSLRGDDSVGLCVASQLAEYELPGVRVRLATSPTQVFDWLGGLQRLIICDACVCSAPCVSAAPVGHLHRWTWPTDQLEQLKFSGSHDMSLPSVLAIADQLGQLPPVVTIWGIAINAERTAITNEDSSVPLARMESRNPATVSASQAWLSEQISAAIPAIVAQVRSAITT